MLINHSVGSLIPGSLPVFLCLSRVLGQEGETKLLRKLHSSSAISVCVIVCTNRRMRTSVKHFSFSYGGNVPYTSKPFTFLVAKGQGHYELMANWTSGHDMHERRLYIEQHCSCCTWLQFELFPLGDPKSSPLCLFNIWCNLQANLSKWNWSCFEVGWWKVMFYQAKLSLFMFAFVHFVNCSTLSFCSCCHARV